MFRKLTDLFYSMRFGQRLCIILILFALIPMLLIQQILMHFYENHIVDSASTITLWICFSTTLRQPPNK